MPIMRYVATCEICGKEYEGPDQEAVYQQAVACEALGAPAPLYSRGSEVYENTPGRQARYAYFLITDYYVSWHLGAHVIVYHVQRYTSAGEKTSGVTTRLESRLNPGWPDKK